MADRADVLIIGAGASGGVAARRLTEAGMKVVCLEQGEWPDPESYPGSRDDWELAARKEWSSSPNIRQRWADYPIDLSASEMTTGNFNGVGGGTVIYNAVWPRMLASDFCGGSIDGATDDWPISYDELLPFFERNDRAFGVSGLGGNPKYPLGDDPPLPPLPIGSAGLLLARAHARLGWHWWPENNAILSAEYAGRHTCVQRGTCPTGCNEGAKGSTDVTHFPQAVAGGATIITGARVHRLPTDQRGLVTGALWLDRNGSEHFQPADVVLCAANGVGTPRLLLLSADGGAPDGLANSSGLVGRRLMLHPCVRVTGYFDEDLQSWQGHFGGAIQCLEFYGTDTERDFVRGAKWSLAPTGGPVGTALPRGSSAVFGPEHHQFMRDRFGRGSSWIMLLEDLPNDNNRVTLSPDMKDASGLAAPMISYTASENSKAMMKWNIDRAIESMEAAGALFTDASDMGGNSHQMGTARMGDDPRTSVVDRWGMSHDVPNLGIIDGSVFVTAGAVNPTSTICALALRAVDHLIERRHEVRVPASRSVYSIPVRLSEANRPPEASPPSPAGDGWLTPSHRTRFATFADTLIPAADGMPGACEVGIEGPLLSWVIAARPDLAPLVARATDFPFDNAPAALASLCTRDIEAYDALLLAVVAGYYHDDEVRRRIGYPGQLPKQIRPSDFPDYITEGLLDFLVEQ